MEVIREFKIADGNKFTATFPDGEKEVLIMTGNAQLWELLKWDIDNDPSAKACADVIVRNLIGVGFADLTPLCPEGMTATVEIIPVGGWDAEVANGAEIFEGDEEE